MRKLDIVCDFDGVLTDTAALKQEVAAELYGVSLPPHTFLKDQVVAEGLLMPEQYDRLVRVVYGSSERNLQLRPAADVRFCLQEIIKAGHRFRVVTAREDQGEHSSAALARAWLRRQFPKEAEYIQVLSPNRTYECSKPKCGIIDWPVDVVLEDGVNDIPDFLKRTQNVLFIVHPYNQMCVPPGVIPVRNFYQAWIKIRELAEA